MFVPFLKTTFPELDRFPELERRQIVTTCMDTEAMKSLQKRSMTYMRLCWAVVAASAIGILLLLKLRVDARWAVWASLGVLLIGVLCLPICIYVFYVRTAHLLRRLIAAKLDHEPSAAN